MNAGKGKSVPSKKKKKSSGFPEHGKAAGFSAGVIEILEQLDRDREAGAPFETAAASFVGRLADSPEMFGELVEALVAKATEWSVPLLELLLKDAAEKENRKHLKRALYRLRQKGFVWEEPAAKEESIWKPPPQPRTFCWLSKLYPEGLREVMLLLPLGIGEYVFMDSYISDRQGILNYQNGVLKSKNLSSFIETVPQSDKDSFIEADPGHCRFLLEEARSVGLGRGEEPDRQFVEDMRYLVRQVPDADVHPLYRRVDQAQVRYNLPLLDDAIKLMEPEHSPIGVIDQTVLESYLQEYTTAAESRIVLNEFQQASRKEEIYRRAAADIFGRPEERQRMRRRLEEVGYFMWEKGFQKEARACAAAAAQMDAAQSSEILTPNPLLIAIARHSLEFYVHQAHEEEEEKHPLLIRRPLLEEEKGGRGLIGD